MNFFILTSIFLAAFSHAETPTVTSKKVFLDKTFQWDSAQVQLKLEVPTDWNDMGDYTDLTLSGKGMQTLHLKNLQNVQVSTKIQFPEKTDQLNKDAFLIPLDEKNAAHALIVMAWLGGSSPDNAWIITKAHSQFHADSKIMYDKKLAAVRDYNGDGKFDLLVRGGHGEPTGEDNFSYDPYLVYVRDAKDKNTSFKYDEVLSKKWSEENHYEWHGDHYNENLRVNRLGKKITE